MLRNSRVKKLVVELRYNPELAFYGKMDGIGLELAEEFPDWQRSSLTLEVRNKTKHRRVFLSYNRVFVDVDEADPRPDRFQPRSAPDEDSLPETRRKAIPFRIGVRQWFAADLDKPFDRVVDELRSDFAQERRPRRHSKRQDKRCRLCRGLRSRGRLALQHPSGADVIKSQWFLTVLHEPNGFEEAQEGEKTFAKFQKSFPEQFLYIDIDCCQEDQPVDKLDKFLASVRRRSTTWSRS